MERKIYRSPDGMIFGVCKGLAEYFDLSLAWIRIGFIIAFAVTLFFPSGLIYLALALILKKKPKEVASQSPQTNATYEQGISARAMHLRQLKDKFSSLESRIRRMENHVTDKAYDWEKRLNTE